MTGMQGSVMPAESAAGKSGWPVTEDLDLTLASNLSAVRMTLKRLVARLMREGVGEETAARVELVLAEVLNNVVKHALRDRSDGVISVNVTREGARLVFDVADEGVPMPGEALPSGAMPSGNGSIEDLPEGGFGWPLIHQLTDEVSYQRQGDWNVLRFFMELSASDQCA